LEIHPFGTVLFYFKKPYDYLRITGNDRLDLINRLSTNQVTSLEKYKGIKTILTTDKGRFADLITLYSFEDFVFAACSINNGAQIVQHLDRYTIMDDFKVENMAGTHETILLFGEDSNKFIEDVFSVKTDALANNDFLIHSEDTRHAMIAKNDDAFGGYNFIYSMEGKSIYNDKLFDPKPVEKYGIIELSRDEFASKRIEYGIPEFGREMSEDTNPLECGLTQYVNFTKGCYIGQEVIARLDTYDKISKHLVGIIAEKKIPDLDLKSMPAITVDGKECGFVTSSAISKRFGNIGLGFVKTSMLDYNKEYKIKLNGNRINCRIIKLPFK
jgi:folate-binding protein YgfZ